MRSLSLVCGQIIRPCRARRWEKAFADSLHSSWSSERRSRPVADRSLPGATVKVSALTHQLFYKRPWTPNPGCFHNTSSSQGIPYRLRHRDISCYALHIIPHTHTICRRNFFILKLPFPYIFLNYFTSTVLMQIYSIHLHDNYIFEQIILV